MLFIAELNGLETWATNIGNAYLESKTTELVYIIAGPEFGKLEVKLSGKRWHGRLSDVLRGMGFTPSKAEPDIWMRRSGDIYEYIAVYVDDLAVAARDPKEIVDKLCNQYKFRLEGTGPIAFHLGCDFFRDEDGVLCLSPKKYIDKMVDAYVRMFGSNPKTTYRSPLEKGDHPEMDTTALLDQDGITMYQSMVGSMQWAVSLVCFGIASAVMTLSSFQTAPCQGHLERAKRVYGYLSKFRDATLRFRTGEPDYSELPEQEFDWMHAVYGNVEELIPHDMLKPLGKLVHMTHFLDANLMHDLLTGILTLLNQTPTDWYSKKQATVETATYGSEFVTSRTSVERDIDLRTTLRYLGVPVHKLAYMFGDNESVVNSSTTPYAKLHKRRSALCFHRAREAIAARVIAYYHVRSEANVSDMLSKHWGYIETWPLLRPLMFWQGDTIDLSHADKGTSSSRRGVTKFDAVRDSLNPG